MVTEHLHDTSSTEQFTAALQAARDGSAEALGSVLDAYRDYLLSVAAREMDPQLRAKRGASDVVQETFMEANRDFPRFRGQSEPEFRKWLRRILLNNLSNFHRDFRETAKRCVAHERPLESERPSQDLLGLLRAGTSTPSGQVMRDEHFDSVAQALSRLPEDYRDIIRLRYMQDLSFEEIAERMGRSNGAVRKLWARALQSLRSEMDRNSPP